MAVFEGDVSAVRSQADTRGQLGTRDLLHIVASARHGDEYRARGAAAAARGGIGAFLCIDTAIRPEMRVLTARADKLHVAGGARDQVDAGLYRPLGVEQGTAGQLAQCQRVAAAVDRQFRVLALRMFQGTRLAAAGRHAMNTAEFIVRPAQEQDFTTVRAPDRGIVETAFAVLGEASGFRAAALDVQPAQRFEDDGLAVR